MGRSVARCAWPRSQAGAADPGICKVYWYYMVFYWYMDVFGCKWIYLDIYMDVDGCIWMYMDVYGCITGCIWMYMDVYGCT